ncbi:glycine cleavage system protein H, partial [archaeon]|nr:glycine cleavage system protein H [archaeon]
MLEVEGYTLPEDVYISLKGLTWARIEGDLVRVGLLDYAQALAGRILFVNLKKPGTKVLFEKPLGTLESGKWAGPI